VVKGRPDHGEHVAMHRPCSGSSGDLRRGYRAQLNALKWPADCRCNPEAELDEADALERAYQDSSDIVSRPRVRLVNDYRIGTKGAVSRAITTHEGFRRKERQSVQLRNVPMAREMNRDGQGSSTWLAGASLSYSRE
jgi:hypothetical protein